MTIFYQMQIQFDFLMERSYTLKFSNHCKIPIFPVAYCHKFFVRLQARPLSSPAASSSLIPVPTNEHIAHLILDQKSASEAIETFRWASKLPAFTHSQSSYRALIHKLCTFRHFDTAKQILGEIPSSIGLPPDDDIFITIIRGLGRAHMIRQVIKVPDLVSGFGRKPSLKIFNTILDVLVKEDIDIAREFYRKKMMGSGAEGDYYTFGILMKGLCLTNRIGDAFKLLQVMKSRGISPNAVIYNTLLHALCKNGKVGRARSLMNEIGAPNDVTFNLLISAYCNEENLVQALVLLEKSFSLGFVPDVVTVTKVVELLCSLNRVTEAVDLLERMERKGGLVDVVAYNTLVRGLCEHGKVKVGNLFLKEMERKGCLPNVDTYNALISGYCTSGMLDSALDLFADMKTEGINCNFVTYDILLKGLCAGGRIEDGFKILELMEDTKRGSDGNISPYNSVLYGLYKENQMDAAVEFLAKMSKLFPRAVLRSFKILGFCEESAIEDAKMVYDEMINEGATPNALVYNDLIHGFCHKGNVGEAFDLMNEMVQHGYFPATSTFNALISEFCSQGKTSSALKLVEDMIARGCVPDTGSYIPIVCARCKSGDFERAVSLLVEMIERGILPDYPTWNSLLLCLAQEKFSSRMGIVNKMVEWIVET